MVTIVINKSYTVKRQAAVFPQNQKVMQALGENIKLARKRRGYTQSLIAERTGFSRITIRKIERGEPSVSMGHYIAVLSVLGLAEDFAKVARDDELGRKLQDIKLMKTSK